MSKSCWRCGEHEIHEHAKERWFPLCSECQKEEMPWLNLPDDSAERRVMHAEKIAVRIMKQCGNDGEIRQIRFLLREQLLPALRAARHQASFAEVALREAQIDDCEMIRHYLGEDGDPDEVYAEPRKRPEIRRYLGEDATTRRPS